MERYGLKISMLSVLSHELIKFTDFTNLDVSTRKLVKFVNLINSWLKKISNLEFSHKLKMNNHNNVVHLFENFVFQLAEILRGLCLESKHRLPM